jgi:hypothetical protein
MNQFKKGATGMALTCLAGKVAGAQAGSHGNTQRAAAVLLALQSGGLK